MVIQSVIFEKSKWTKSKAIQWLNKHNYIHPKVDIKENYLRFRQRPPNSKKKYRTISLKNGVKLIDNY